MYSRPTEALRALAADYEGQAAAVRRVGGEVRDRTLAAALTHAADILDSVSIAFGECATDGTHAPMEDLAERNADWLREVMVFAPTDLTADELARLADDGSPHAVVEGR